MSDPELVGSIISEISNSKIKKLSLERVVAQKHLINLGDNQIEELYLHLMATTKMGLLHLLQQIAPNIKKLDFGQIFIDRLNRLDPDHAEMLGKIISNLEEFSLTGMNMNSKASFSFISGLEDSKLERLTLYLNISRNEMSSDQLHELINSLRGSPIEHIDISFTVEIDCVEKVEIIVAAILKVGIKYVKISNLQFSSTKLFEMFTGMLTDCVTVIKS
ncbi:hypothetical protein ROZALSC1DRAFT_29955 [Rozella allomycis CSF55]|uniref:RNI-like protein n=1 Tax=Rozella allomycis (strain CSF55) TaxID=988480 RepID=A0A4P9YH66_ROZAC|nr:hypothetical protein ROZALSC1DRAFT_29955 [Rozella allomycis CSF55]